ncbi:MAG: hypothetical protein AMJ73_08190 [candidate division Zixibacteria bacterium SM1_73]|nr:MAG: hypothetical protein AMJ73_08190 [candidate division Zixibacteria bacterium SM1_73]
MPIRGSPSKNSENTNLSFSAKRRISLFKKVETPYFAQGDTKKQFFSDSGERRQVWNYSNWEMWSSETCLAFKNAIYSKHLHNFLSSLNKICAKNKKQPTSWQNCLFPKLLRNSQLN